MKLTVISKAAIALCFVSTTALAATATKPRVEPRVGSDAVKVEPSVKGNTGSKVEVKDGRAQVKAECSNQQLAIALTKGTRVSVATANAVLDAKLVNKGICGTSALDMSAQARENLLETADNALRNGADRVAAGSARINLYANGLKAALANDAGAVEVSAASLVPAVQKLQTECAYLQ